MLEFYLLCENNGYISNNQTEKQTVNKVLLQCGCRVSCVPIKTEKVQSGDVFLKERVFSIAIAMDPKHDMLEL